MSFLRLRRRRSLRRIREGWSDWTDIGFLAFVLFILLFGGVVIIYRVHSIPQMDLPGDFVSWEDGLAFDDPRVIQVTTSSDTVCFVASPNTNAFWSSLAGGEQRVEFSQKRSVWKPRELAVVELNDRLSGERRFVRFEFSEK